MQGFGVVRPQYLIGIEKILLGARFSLEVLESELLPVEHRLLSRAPDPLSQRALLLEKLIIILKELILVGDWMFGLLDHTTD